MDALRYDSSNYFRDAIFQSAIPLSALAKNKLLALINTLTNNSTDFTVLKQAIVDWEGEIQAISGQFSDEELAKLLASASIARYGCYIWLKREACCAAPNFDTARGNFWHWLGAVVGAIVAVVVTSILWGPLTVGGISFSA